MVGIRETGRSLLLVLGLVSPAVAEDRFFDSNGVQIRYVEQGQGAPVVLIHGYSANLERHWINSGILAALAKQFRVIALDCRGHGKSDKATDPSAYGVEMGRDVIRLLDHLKIPRAHVVGFSMGAFIAGHLAAREADRLLSATFVGHHPVRTWTVADEDEYEAAARDLESDTPFRRLILALSPPGLPPSENEIRRLSRALTESNDPRALAAYHRGVRTLALADAEIAAIRIPALGIIGSEDPARAGMHELKTIMPGLPVVVVDRAGHGGDRGVLRRPEFLAALRAFLAGIR